MPTRVQVRSAVIRCRNCELWSRNHFSPIPFRGPDKARYLVIGEAPGRVENEIRKPFVGPAGRLVEKWFEQAGVDIRSQVAFANTVSCYPGEKTAPGDIHIKACRNILLQQVEYLSPSSILLVGNIATSSIWPQVAIGDLRGRWFSWQDRPTMATYHPAACLRNPSISKYGWEDAARYVSGPRSRVEYEESARDYRCVKCNAQGEAWKAPITHEDVSDVPGALGLAWCLRCWGRYTGSGGDGRPLGQITPPTSVQRRTGQRRRSIGRYQGVLEGVEGVERD
jgi:uracil-DNA glycosylase family 4